MKKTFLFLTFLTLFISCKTQNSITNQPFQSIKTDTILSDKISIRAILVDKDKLWYAADKNRFGYYDLKTAKHFQKTLHNLESKLEFRSIAQTKDAVFVANVANPAYIFKINKQTMQEEMVYTETHEKVFYDSMNFWNNSEGILIGDPIENCLSILITRDGGSTWQKIPCDKLPKTVEGEAAFAASNTNISIQGNNTWVVSGGKKSRVFFSPDKGTTWQVFETPIVQGKEMTGIFTADFYNDSIGFAAGGNYEILTQNFQNKAITTDGGKTWNLTAEYEGFGYASCVQFIPNSDGKQLVTVGATGLQYSADSGKSWKQFLKDDSLYTIRFVDKNTAFAAGKNRILKIEFLK